MTALPRQPGARGDGPCGGIDLGGTKIEARLFDGAEARTVTLTRAPTPRDSFDDLITALADAARWLIETAGAPDLPIGLSIPGLIDPETQVSFASNIPATGHAIGPSLTRATGRAFPVVNDCMAFAYSEAHGGAGAGHRAVMGLILGTGVGGGYCLDGALPHRHAGLAVEVGHLGMPARTLARHDLPLWPCGCGRHGCVENYISGTGLANIAEWHIGTRIEAPDLVASTDPAAARTLAIWADLAGATLDAIQLLLDPDCIILGGGLSNLPGIATSLSDNLRAQRLGTARLPHLAPAAHGDSSGARGAALLARLTAPT